MNPLRPLSLVLAALLGVPSVSANDPEFAALVAKAERGNAIAQYNVGLAYAEGRGVAADPVEAYVWLALAQENGARGRALDALLPRLTEAQRAAAAARLAERRPVPRTEDPAPGVAVPDPAGSTDEADALRRELAQARADRQELSNELAAAWREADAFRAQLAETRAAAAPAADSAALTRERDALAARLTEADATQATLQADRERLQRLAAQVQRDLTEARETARAQQERTRLAEMKAGEFERRAAAQEEDLSQLRRNLAAAQLPREHPELDAARQTAAALRNDLENQRQAGAQLSAALTRAGEERAALERQLANALANAAELGQETASLRQQLAARPAPSAAPAYPDLRARVGELESQVTALRNAPPSYPDLRPQVARLEAALAAAESRPSAPDHPDLRARVRELETALSDARQAAPAYPDLRAKVAGLESELAEARRAPATEATGTEGLARQLAAAEDKLATALRGYALLQREHEELRAQGSRTVHELETTRDQLTARLAAAEEGGRLARAEAARLAESLAALQRSSAEGGTELAATRALLQQVQGANTVLAQENYQLKAALARDPQAARAAAPAVSAPRTHTVEAGDSLGRISQRYYGTTGRWQEIYEANRETLANQNSLRVGMVLRIP